MRQSSQKTTIIFPQEKYIKLMYGVNVWENPLQLKTNHDASLNWHKSTKDTSTKLQQEKQRLVFEKNVRKNFPSKKINWDLRSSSRSKSQPKKKNTK